MRSLGGGSHLKVIDVESSTTPERVSGGLDGTVCTKIMSKTCLYRHTGNQGVIDKRVSDQQEARSSWDHYWAFNCRRRKKEVIKYSGL